MADAADVDALVDISASKVAAVDAEIASTLFSGNSTVHVATAADNLVASEVGLGNLDGR